LSKLASEEQIAQSASEIVNLIYGHCKELGLVKSTEKHRLIEAIRIVASNLLIAIWTGFSLLKVTNKAELGIQETSPRIDDESKGFVRTIVSQIVDTIDYREVIGMVSEISAYEFSKILESIHAITVYSDIDFDDMGIQSNGSLASRKMHGAFYTPSSITHFICENTIGLAFDEAIDQIERSNSSIEILIRLMNTSVIDPACGPGTFLVETLNVLRARYNRLFKQIKTLVQHDSHYRNDIQSIKSWLENEQMYLNHFVRGIYGVDVDPAAAEIAAICVSAFVSKKTDNLKLPFLDTIKPGNSLVSEFLPGLIRPSEIVINRLLSKREKLRRVRKFEKRKTEYLEYRKTIRDIEETTFIDVDVKRASSILTDQELSSNFCWELEFPEVFLKGSHHNSVGFTFAVMNPPYDILKLNRSEYVYPRQNLSEREAAIQEFEELKQRERNLVAFFRESGQYELSIDNVLNLYRLMIERTIRITSSGARIGFIVPSTLLCDSSSRKLRQMILHNYNILGIDDFSEKANVFEGVTQAVCIFRFDKSKRSLSVPIAMHESNSISEIGEFYNQLSLEMIESVSGNHLNIPRVPSQSWEMLEKIHRWPSVSEISWIINRRGELDLTAYKQFITQKETDTRLIRGNHIGRYSIKWDCKSKECYVHRDDFLRALGASNKINDTVRPRIAGQQICNMVQKWRLKFGLIEPNTILGNSCNYLAVNGTDDNQKNLMFLLAIMNSHLLNWRFKITSTNNHVNNNEIDMLPIPNPESMNEYETKLYKRICNNAEELVRKYDAQTEYETEAMIFRLYGLEKEEALTILRFQGANNTEMDEILHRLGIL
jgi:Alw26I/Eco31I/Esp3I family type II restriction m6 adenine DNA methyltransferase